MRSRWGHAAAALALAIVVLGTAAGCGGGGSGDDDKAAGTTPAATKPDKTRFCQLWSQFQTGTSYHPDLAAYRTFWNANDKVAKQLVVVAPEDISEDVQALADGVASIKAELGGATSAGQWSPEETRIYMKSVRRPEVAVSDFADQSCPPAS